MKALRCKTFGPPENLVLEEVPALEPKDTEVVIEVYACSANFPDTLIIRNLYQFKPQLPFSPGGEVAGKILSLGSKVKGYSVGDSVIALCGWGGFAQQVSVEVEKVIPMPKGMSYKVASSLLYNFGTSFHALQDRAKVLPGQKVLVLGAAGGVGLAAVQIAKQMGAQVFAAASTSKKLELCKKYGADVLINYNEVESLKDHLKEITAGNGVDVVYDPVGGALAEQALRSLAWQGKYLVVGFAAGDIPKIPLNLALLKGVDIQGVFWGRFTTEQPLRSKFNLNTLSLWYQQGKIAPHIDACYDLENGVKALLDLQNRKVLGKVVVAPFGVNKAVEINEPAEEKNTSLYFKSIGDLKKYEGQSLGTSKWLLVDQELVNRFAHVTNDKQWIHLDKERTKLSNLGGTIAHGFLTLSLQSELLGSMYELGFCKSAINYGVDKVRFTQPVAVGSFIRIHAQLISVVEYKPNIYKMITEIKTEVKGLDKPAAVVNSIGLLYC